MAIAFFDQALMISLVDQHLLTERKRERERKRESERERGVCVRKQVKECKDLA
jgi:hypothetical protein